MLWFAVALLVVSVAVSVTMSPSTPKVTATASTSSPSTLEDFDVPTAEDGKQMPVIFGTVTLKSANIIWYGDLDYTEVTETTTSTTESSGGK